MGTNASGKTSLGKAINTIFAFIRDRNIGYFYPYLLDRSRASRFSIDFLYTEDYLYRLECEFLEDKVLFLNVYGAEITDADSYETCIKNLKKLHSDDENDYIKKLAVLKPFGWAFTFPKDEMATYRIRGNSSKLNLSVLEKILIALDSSIIKVEKSSEVIDSYVIRSKNGDMFVQEGRFVGRNILSSGTKAGIDIAYLIASMMCSIPLQISKKY